MTVDVARWVRMCVAGAIIVSSGVLLAYHLGYVRLERAALYVAVTLALANFVYMLLPFGRKGRV